MAEPVSSLQEVAAVASSTVKPKLADVEAEGLDGELVSVAVGATRSTVKVVATTALTLPPVSTDRARTV